MKNTALVVLLGWSFVRCRHWPEAGNPSEKTDGFTDTPMEPDGKWHVHDRAGPQPPVVTPGATFSQGAPAPADAEVLFDGTGLAKWENDHGGPATWITNADYVESVVRLDLGGGIRTKGKWADFQLHVEWASPNPPKGRPGPAATAAF